MLVTIALFVVAAAAAVTSPPTGSEDPFLWTGQWVNETALAADQPAEGHLLLRDERGRVWVRREFFSDRDPGATEPLPPMTAARACRAMESYDALLLLGDSNTRHLVMAILTQLAGDARKGLCPLNAPYWSDELEAAMLRANPALHITRNSPEAEFKAAVCEHCFGGRSPRAVGADSRLCQGSVPLDHTMLSPAQHPCGGTLSFHYIDCGPCGRSGCRGCLFFPCLIQSECFFRQGRKRKPSRGPCMRC